MILAGHETTATRAVLVAVSARASIRPPREKTGRRGCGVPPSTATLRSRRLKFTPRGGRRKPCGSIRRRFLIARARPPPPTPSQGLPVRKKRSGSDRARGLFAPPMKKLWNEPNAFIPSRFMPGAPPPDRFAYLPFGVGARVCIGGAFCAGGGDTGARQDDRRVPASSFSTRPPVMPVGIVTTQPDQLADVFASHAADWCPASEVRDTLQHALARTSDAGGALANL